MVNKRNSRNEFVDYVLELMRPLGAVSARAMFGGHGIYHGDRIFAIVIDDTLYFKVDDGNRAEFKALGLDAFVYKGKRGSKVSMSYTRAPDEALESPHLMSDWARSAISASLRSASAKKKSPAKKPLAKKPSTR